jgi:alpha-L-rhamnosidase
VIGDFDGLWITSIDAARKDSSVLHFHKQSSLASIPVTFITHVSADNQFVLHVNGQFVGTCPSRGDIGHWRYEPTI